MKRLRKHAVRRFEERLAAVLPRFERYEVDCPIAGEVYRFPASAKLDLLIVLTVDADREAFGLSVGNAPPGADLWQCSFEGPEPCDAPGQLFSLAFFWQPDDASWRLVEPEAAARLRRPDDSGEICWTRDEAARWVASHPEMYSTNVNADEQFVFSLVDKMFEGLQQHAVPYFERLAGTGLSSGSK